MKAKMEINIKDGWATMAAFVVHTAAKIVSHLAKAQGKSGKGVVQDHNGKSVGSWQIES